VNPALKTKARFSSYHLMHSLSRALRVIGWFIVCLTVGYSIPLSLSIYQSSSTSRWMSERAFEYTFSQTTSLLFLGLSTAACAFLLSAALYTGLQLLAERRTQIALLERLVRERREKLSPNQTIVLIENL
jgi:hypothetical protein